MGYYSRLEGDLTFSREVDEDVVRRLGNELPTFQFAGEFSTGGWDNWQEQGKMYGLREDADKLVELLAGYGITVRGELVVLGEGNGDIARYVFKDGTVKFEQAKIFWPDGSEHVPVW